MPKKLLVADDSLTIQKVIRLALSGAASSGSEGYEIQAVSDGNDAVQQISLFRPDIVLIDVSLPGKSAFEVKRSTNQHRDLSQVRFVLMSSAFEKVDETQVSEVGFHGRLTKPFDPAHLRDVLSQVLGKSPPAPPSIEAEDAPMQFLANSTPPPPPDPEGDIRNLTESTIRMSGLAEFAANPPAELPPDLPHFNTSAPMSFDPPPEPPSALPDDFQWNIQEHSLKPPMMDSGDSTFPLAPPGKAPSAESYLEFTPPPMPNASIDEEPISPPPAEMASGTARREDHVAALDSEALKTKIEGMIREEVEAAIRKAAQETLPDIIERVIKEEIHRLLQESP